ncbi:hypothetical protein KY289_001555 [Solanum tuberosum]|nr:hypothetical protein KY289_001555 [Solanum tuberosum]
MSQSPSSSQKMMDILNEIDLFDFVSPSINSFPTPISTSPLVDDCQTPTTEVIAYFIDKAPPVRSPSLNLNDHQNSSPDEGDLTEEKNFDSNISAASDELVVQSLTEIRESVRTPLSKEGDRTQEDPLETSEPKFDKTPEVILPSTTADVEEDEDNLHLR